MRVEYVERINEIVVALYVHGHGDFNNFFLFYSFFCVCGLNAKLNRIMNSASQRIFLEAHFIKKRTILLFN